MPDGKAIGERVVVGVVSAVALGVLTLLWNWASKGGVIRALDGVTQKEFSQSGAKPIKFKVIEFPYENNTSWNKITGSDGAIFCGLTLVDDDAQGGKCEIREQGDYWEARTGGDGKANTCQATCLLAQQ